MKKVLIFCSLIILLFLGIFFGFSQWYLWTENSNFEKARVKSQLNCQTMPYHCAIRDQNLSSISELKSKNFNIDSRDLWQRTALIYAILQNTSGVNELISAGANVNLYDDSGESALSHALNIKNFKLADVLISNGADVNFKIKNGTKNLTLLTKAITNKNIEVTKYLLSQKASLEFKDDYGYNACERIKLYHLEREMSFINCNKL